LEGREDEGRVPALYGDEEKKKRGGKLAGGKSHSARQQGGVKEKAAIVLGGSFIKGKGMVSSLSAEDERGDGKSADMKGGGEGGGGCFASVLPLREGERSRTTAGKKRNRKKGLCDQKSRRAERLEVEVKKIGGMALKTVLRGKRGAKDI